ncbi:uncharacterized protein ACLA_053910 [Aspergillus clavatus NRRL 1]|uniref:FAD-dependent oxidoreductase-like enzyme n=1 Tax=Aspergillus clavatus (strain ATCC 1007 / CBS 513.65 / DSM 816 / NCTC 3887 / NRRL 1 / QM 1276 / 107) TaxID=344612 RepID=A1C921_ASPCL|nr:uncharacterized protein ACLA_053910 [Aspergillus clavatus NRRL 1]EAW13345.1 conserved hypothetical protein [Aspergillus clavatus NRRL 1]
MSQETPLSQSSLAPPVELREPTIPIQRPSLSASPELDMKQESQVCQTEKRKLDSPPSLASSEMTPPPSSQVPGAPLRTSRSRSASYLASPPDLSKTLCAAYGASENLPTVNDIDNASETDLRTIAKELLGVAQEARMSALHFKLQNSLLSFTSNEAIKRAEVEHQLARREVEILQSSEYRNRQCSSEVKPLLPISNVELEVALKRNQELERVNATFDRRLRRAKKLIEQEKEKSDLLREENNLLKKRIRENREHFSRMMERGSMSPSSQTQSHALHRRSVPHFPESTSPHVSRGENHPFAALLAADRVLNRESSEFHSSPQRSRQRQHPNGHVRGTHSLSSLPLTPSHSRTVHEESQLFTPARNSNDEHRDRDSTISASDIEEAETEEDIPASQAGSMLRHNPVVSQQQIRHVASAPKTSTLLQTKLFGQVRKASVERPPNGLKRKANIEESATSKKSKPAEGGGVGLGIEA